MINTATNPSSYVKNDHTPTTGSTHTHDIWSNVIKLCYGKMYNIQWFSHCKLYMLLFISPLYIHVYTFKQLHCFYM
jgi:hypothetical protein